MASSRGKEVRKANPVYQATKEEHANIFPKWILIEFMSNHPDLKTGIPKDWSMDGYISAAKTVKSTRMNRVVLWLATCQQTHILLVDQFLDPIVSIVPAGSSTLVPRILLTTVSHHNLLHNWLKYTHFLASRPDVTVFFDKKKKKNLTE